MTTNNPNITNILALDCAIDTGSIALLRNGELLSPSEVGSPSRAEEVLRVVESVLTAASMTVRDLDRIAVSIGPGSYSGIRIGMATAIGLANALDIRCVGLSSLEAMAKSLEANETALITAVAVGKKQAAWQAFDRSNFPAGPPQLASQEVFIDTLASRSDVTLFAHRQLLDRLGASIPSVIDIRDAGLNLAKYIAAFAETGNLDSTSLTPLYLRDKSLEDRVKHA